MAHIAPPILEQPILQVIIYTGHSKTKHPGVYGHNVQKRREMVAKCDAFRVQFMGRKPWEVLERSGEQLLETLEFPKKFPLHNTLLVFPAGESSDFEAAMKSTPELVDFISNIAYPLLGLKIDTNCGSGYPFFGKRIYTSGCRAKPFASVENPMITNSLFQLFPEASAISPLCPSPGLKFESGFYHDVVKIKAVGKEFGILLSGGGSILLDESAQKKCTVLATYLPEELTRLGIPEDKLEIYQNAVVLHHGGLLISMGHPYYRKEECDPERAARNFPQSKTDWKKVFSEISSEEDRIWYYCVVCLDALEKLITYKPLKL